MENWRFDLGKHLVNSIFEFKLYKPSDNNDHDHCDFCGKKFCSIISNDGSETEGYVTIMADKKGRKQEHWVCKECFTDFKDMLNFKLK